MTHSIYLTYITWFIIVGICGLGAFFSFKECVELVKQDKKLDNFTGVGLTMIFIGIIIGAFAVNPFGWFM